MVPPASHRISRVPWYSGSPAGVQSSFAYGAITLSGRPFQTVLLEAGLVTPWDRWGNPCRALQPRCGIGPQATKPQRFGLFPFRSPLLRESRLISFPRPTKMFQFGRCPPLAYGFSQRCLGIPPGGFPHSGIPGSQPAGGSPGLIAASHALHRPLAPRHPPCALSSLTLGLPGSLLILFSC